VNLCWSRSSQREADRSEGGCSDERVLALARNQSGEASAPPPPPCQAARTRAMPKPITLCPRPVCRWSAVSASRWFSLRVACAQQVVWPLMLLAQRACSTFVPDDTSTPSVRSVGVASRTWSIYLVKRLQS
jgi:hypothetical protein